MATPPFSSFSTSLGSPGGVAQHSFGGGPELVEWHKTDQLACSNTLDSGETSDAQRNLALDHTDFGHSTLSFAT